MKLQRNHVATEATQRDTVGRNRVRVLLGDSIHVKQLDIAQRTFSSDSVEKMTHVLIVDEKDDRIYLLKYRLLDVETEKLSEPASRIMTEAGKTSAFEFSMYEEAAINQIQRIKEFEAEKKMMETKRKNRPHKADIINDSRFSDESSHTQSMKTEEREDEIDD